MVYVDRWLIVGILGFLAAIVFAAGEFLGWWDLLGEFGFWFSLAVGLAGFMFNATRGQGRLILGGMKDLMGSSGRVEAGIGRVETGVGRVETGIGRVEAGVGRVEAGVGRVEAGVGRVEANTGEMVGLLREIRDAVRGPG